MGEAEPAIEFARSIVLVNDELNERDPVADGDGGDMGDERAADAELPHRGLDEKILDGENVAAQRRHVERVVDDHAAEPSLDFGNEGAETRVGTEAVTQPVALARAY